MATFTWRVRWGRGRRSRSSCQGRQRKGGEQRLVGDEVTAVSGRVAAFRGSCRGRRGIAMTRASSRRSREARELWAVRIAVSDVRGHGVYTVKTRVPPFRYIASAAEWLPKGRPAQWVRVPRRTMGAGAICRVRLPGGISRGDGRVVSLGLADRYPHSCPLHRLAAHVLSWRWNSRCHSIPGLRPEKLRAQSGELSGQRHVAGLGQPNAE
jgi:hypothetical protein